jgi:two-component system, LuxR family, sensor kinase FixL
MDALQLVGTDTSIPATGLLADATLATPTATTILTLDDNSAVRQATVAMLKAAGFQAIGLADSIEALCAIAHHQPRAVLIDADSGPLAPWQLAQLIQQHPEHTQAVLIYTSKYDDAIERAKAKAANIDLFLAKPFTAEEVLALLNTGVRA